MVNRASIPPQFEPLLKQHAGRKACKAKTSNDLRMRGFVDAHDLYARIDKQPKFRQQPVHIQVV